MTSSALLAGGMLLCACAAAATRSPSSPGDAPALVVANVTVIDGTGAPARPATTIVIRGDRIEAIGRTGRVAVPAGSRVIDGTGKFMIPGLWDMHVHLTDARPSAIPALVANGVTGVRDMGSRLREVDEWRVKIEEGVVIGPRILRAGPILNGKEFGPVQLAVADSAQARAAVRTLAKVGVDFVKIHMTMTRDQFLAVVDEAKKAGLPVAGHVPAEMAVAEASDSGQASIEHVETLFQSRTVDLRAPREQLLEELTRLFRRLARNRTFYTPCLVAYKASADWRDFTPHPQSRYVARSANARMLTMAEQYRKSPEILAGRKRVLGDFLVFVGLMRREGVKVMTGTDLSDGRVFPGFSVHEELALLVDAGFTPSEAIQAATRVPAEFLRLGDAGTVQPGKRADLVLLSANPLEDIGNTTKIDAVVLRGQLLDRQRLDGLLRDAERFAANY